MNIRVVFALARYNPWWRWHAKLTVSSFPLFVPDVEVLAMSNCVIAGPSA